jgi:gas vesicle protein
MSKDKSGSTGKFMLGAAIGGAIGAIVGVLTAPKSGKETRADIKKKAGEAKEFAGAKAKEVKKTAKKAVKKAKKAGETWRDNILNGGENDDKAETKPAAKK